MENLCQTRPGTGIDEDSRNNKLEYNQVERKQQCQWIHLVEVY